MDATMILAAAKILAPFFLEVLKDMKARGDSELEADADATVLADLAAERAIKELELK